MFCVNCGAQLPDDAKFCTNCGATLRKPEGTPSTVNAAAPAPNTPAQPVASPKPRSKKPLVIGAATIALLAIVGVAGYFIWSVFFAPYPIDKKTFPDAAVRASLSSYDADGDGKLSREEAGSVEYFSVTGAQTLDGLDTCPNITSLEVYSEVSPITELKLNGFHALEDLKLVGSTTQSELDLSGNTSLTDISISLDGLQNITLPRTDSIEQLYVDGDAEVEGLEEAGFSEVWVPMEDEEGVFSIQRDDSGRIQSIAVANYDYDYEYDEEGNLASVEIDSAFQTRPQTTDYFIDDDGNLQDSDFEYTYDDQGRITRMEYRDLEGHYLEYTYDEAGNVVKIYDARGNGLPYEYTYEYDENARVTKASELDSESGEVISERTFTYDDAGHLQEITHDGTSMAGRAPIATFSYDEETRTLTGVSSFSEAAGAEPHYLAIQYDEQGDVIAFDESNHELTSAEDGNKISYARYFVKEGAAPPPQGVRLDLTYDTYIAAQIDSMFAYYMEGPEMVLEAKPYVDQSAYSLF